MFLLLNFVLCMFSCNYCTHYTLQRKLLEVGTRFFCFWCAALFKKSHLASAPFTNLLQYNLDCTIHVSLILPAHLPPQFCQNVIVEGYLPPFDLFGPTCFRSNHLSSSSPPAYDGYKMNTRCIFS